MKNELNDGELVQCDNKWFGRVCDFARTEDGEIVAYYVVPLDDRENTWVDSDNIVSYAALRAAFGPIDYIEKSL